MNRPFSLAASMAVLVLGGCQSSTFALLEPENVVTRNEAPPGALPGTCWGQDETPAVIETVTEQVILQPEDGAPVYKTETHQEIVKPRMPTWFETPCDEDLTPEFTATVQRALKARGHYRGQPHGRMDRRTRAAIRAYQKPQGLDSGKLSIAAARQMGLIAIKTPGVTPDPEPEVARATPDLPGSDGSLVAALARAEQERLARVAAQEKEREARRKAETDDLARQQAAYQKAEQNAAKKEAKAEAKRKARQEAARAKETKELARQQAAYQKAEAKAAARAEAESAEREKQRKAAAKAAEQAKLAQAQQAEKAKRARELQQALEDEKARNGGEPSLLPISSESF